MVTPPSSALQFPYATEPIPYNLDDVLALGDFLSPSGWLLKGIDFVFGFNPGDTVTEWVGGDWHGVSVAGSALRQLAEYHQLAGRDVYGVRGSLVSEWSGIAAANAGIYFEKLAIALEGVAPTLRDIASQLQTTAMGIKNMATTLSSLLGRLLDALIAAAISAAAGAATSETGIGALIGAIGAAYGAWSARQIWLEALKTHALAVELMSGTVGLVTGYLGTLRTDLENRLPTASYDHPAIP